MHGAHHDVVKWAEPFGDDWARAFRECPRGDWLLGLAARRGVDRRAVVRAACACARLGLAYLPDGDRRPLAAIEAAERYADGNDDPAARAEAKRAVEIAVDVAPDPTVAAAAAAALAAISSVESPDQAAAAAVAVAQAAVLDAGDCAMLSALTYTQSACADRVRDHVSVDAIAPKVSSRRDSAGGEPAP